MTKISVKEAADKLGVSEQFIRMGLQKGVLPFGWAVNISGGKRFTYFINPKKFAEYVKE